jgi:hypothetical protein
MLFALSRLWIHLDGFISKSLLRHYNGICVLIEARISIDRSLFSNWQYFSFHWPYIDLQ